MTPDAFRAAAMSLPGVSEHALMDTLTYRVRHKGFATIGWPEAGWAVVKLSRQEQLRLMRQSHALAVEPGVRGKRGVTLIRLSVLEPDIAADVLSAAWREVYGPGDRAVAAAATTALAGLQL